MGKRKWNRRQIKKKKNYEAELAVAGILILGLLVFLLVMKNREDNRSYEYCEEYVMTEEVPFFMKFCYYSKEEWQDMIEEEEFGGAVTIGMLKWLREQTGTAEYVVLPEKNDRYIVTREEFNQVYDQFLDLLDVKDEVETADKVILKQEGDSYITETETYTSELELSFVKPMKSYEFYVSGEHIIGIRNLKGTLSSIDNVYLLEEEGQRISFLYKGETYEISMTDWETKGVAGQVCDLIWEKGELSKIQLKEDRIQGSLIAVNDSRIQIEGYGEIKRSKNLPVYKVYGTVEEKSLSDIVIANMKVEYVVAKDRVEAILLVEPADISRIRVLILGEGAGIYREEVFLTCSTPFTVDRGDKEEEKEGETPVRGSELFKDEGEGSIRFQAKEEAGEFFVCDESGQKKSLGYPGTMEIYRYPEGYTLVNELSIEDYLCRVVPSEMPASYGAEALKAQAVCARSYVYIQMKNNTYAALGAHVDDSTNYQEYNKQEQEKATDNAVWDTAGMVLKYQGEIAEAFYFSTSSGVTGNGDCWGLDQDPKYGYLRSIQLKDNQEEFDFSNEEVYREYIQSQAKSYDSFSPLYRWEAVCNYNDTSVQKKIRGILAARKEAAPDSVTYLDKDGKEIENAKKFGKLQRISVQKRGTTGIILELCLEYKKGKVILSNEYGIRSVLGAGRKSLTLSDGSTRDDFSMLPSAFAVLIPVENTDYHIKGGGYGHGIGMSQNGARKLAEMGKTYEEILKFFFQNVEILPVS